MRSPAGHGPPRTPGRRSGSARVRPLRPSADPRWARRPPARPRPRRADLVQNAPEVLTLCRLQLPTVVFNQGTAGAVPTGDGPSGSVETASAARGSTPQRYVPHLTALHSQNTNLGLTSHDHAETSTRPRSVPKTSQERVRANRPDPGTIHARHGRCYQRRIQAHGAHSGQRNRDVPQTRQNSRLPVR